MTQHHAELLKIKAACENFLPPGSFIAGGALTSAFTSKSINDVDLYFKSREMFESAIVDAYDSSLWCVAATDRAVTFVKNDAVIQLMHFDFFGCAADVFDAFDYTVCMAAYDIDGEQFAFHDDFFKHAAQRHLSFHKGTRYPFGSLLRVLKYQPRGYSIGRGDLLRIALCCHKTPVTSWEELARAVGGQYGEKVKLSTDQPFSMESAIDLIQATDFTVPAERQEMPGSAEDLLQHLAQLATTPHLTPALPLDTGERPEERIEMSQDTTWSIAEVFPDTWDISSDKYASTEYCAIVDQTGKTVAFAVGASMSLRPVNLNTDHAHLIAAAPSLLSALEDLFGAGLEAMIKGGGHEDQIEALNKASAAMASAKATA